MPSYQYLIAKRLPELSIGFEDLKLREEKTDGSQLYDYSYNAADGVIARLQVEMKERVYSKYYLNEVNVLQSLRDRDIEHYMAYYIIPEKRLLLWNVSLCPKVRRSMKDVFKNYRGMIDRYVYEVKPEDSCLDIEFLI